MKVGRLFQKSFIFTYLPSEQFLALGENYWYDVNSLFD